jgi:outer membrane protein assembly factor BamB
MNLRPWMLSLVLAAAASAWVMAAAPEGKDWPQWRGAHRDGVSRETGLLQDWKDGPPPQLWKINTVGEGYSTVAIANDRIYTQGNIGGQEKIICLDEADGGLKWAVIPEGSTEGYVHRRGDGPRGTPTIEGNRVYAEGGNGDVSCLDAATGERVWHVQLVEDLSGKLPAWGFSESPLIDGHQVIVTPGGTEGAVAALDKQTGKVIWRSKEVTDGAHYSSAIAVDFGGVHQIIQFTASRVVGLDAKDGRLLWDYAGSANKTANVCTPIYHDGCVFTSSAYGTGGGLVQLKKTGDNFEAEELWFNKPLANHHGGVVLVDGYLYGFGQALICLDFKTGEEKWKNRSVGKGSLCYADHRLYCVGEKQEVALVEANPKEYVEHGRFSIPDTGKPSWAHPVVANGRLYIRDQNTLTCFDVRAK